MRPWSVVKNTRRHSGMQFCFCSPMLSVHLVCSGQVVLDKGRETLLELLD